MLKTIKIVCFLLTTALLGCGGGDSENSSEQAGGSDNTDVQVLGAFDASTQFDVGTIALSMSPEDNRLAWIKDQNGNFWDFYGLRDSSGEPTKIDKIVITSGNSLLTFFYGTDGRLMRIESIESDTGESSALQFTYLSETEIKVDGFDAITTDLNNPDASEIITLASPLQGLSSTVALSKDWNEIIHETTNNRLSQAILRDELGSKENIVGQENVNAQKFSVIAKPITEIKATFRVSVKTEIGDVVNDANVTFDISGPDRAPNVTAVPKSNGVFEAEVTLAKTAEIAEIIAECNRMVKVGKNTLDVTIVILGAVGGGVTGGPAGAGIGVALGALITKALGVLGQGIEISVLANFVSDSFERGTCAGVIDYLANVSGGNLTVSATALSVASRPSLKPITGASAIVRIEQLASGKTLWPAPDIIIPNPVSGGLEDVSVDSRNITLTFRDTGVEDDDKVEVRLKRAGNNTFSLVFSGTLTNAGISRPITLSPGVNTIEIVALNEGTLGRNTAGIQISNVVSGNTSQSWGLSTLERATFTIFSP